jgi:itaconyl-CoA hydratase
MFSAYYRVGENRYQERFGLDFEDFAPGQRFRHRPGITLSQQDNTDEALDTLNAAMLHYDAHYADATTWKRPLMVSTVTLQKVIGMASKTFGRRQRLLGFSEIALTAPLFGGDTLYTDSTIQACEPGPDADTGAVRVLLSAMKPDGSAVGRFTCTMAIYRRGAGPDAIAGEAANQPRFAAYHQDGDELVEQVGLFFEDCIPGESFIHYPRRSFFREDSVRHAWRALELGPQYHDLDWIERHGGGRHVVGETYVISVATAATTRTFGRVAANLGWYDIALPNPVFVGDTIEVESTILETRESRSRPQEGIVSVATRARNQHGEEVLSYRRNLLVYRRAAETPYRQAGY